MRTAIRDASQVGSRATTYGTKSTCVSRHHSQTYNNAERRSLVSRNRGLPEITWPAEDSVVGPAVCSQVRKGKGPGPPWPNANGAECRTIRYALIVRVIGSAVSAPWPNRVSAPSDPPPQDPPKPASRDPDIYLAFQFAQLSKARPNYPASRRAAESGTVTRGPSKTIIGNSLETGRIGAQFDLGVNVHRPSTCGGPENSAGGKNSTPVRELFARLAIRCG